MGKGLVGISWEHRSYHFITSHYFLSRHYVPDSVLGWTGKMAESQAVRLELLLK